MGNVSLKRHGNGGSPGGVLRRWFRQRKVAAWRFVAAAAVAFTLLPACRAGEGPLFITYTHQMEEPGNLEFAAKNVFGAPGDANRFLGTAVEFEYGVKGWWTSEWYLDGQTTATQSALFTGYRWENRFRLLHREHWINPVLYMEFENIDGADKTLLEVVNHDGKDDLAAPNDEARREKKREVEAKLILGSYFKGWTIAENFIAEKNVRTHLSNSAMRQVSAVPSLWRPAPSAATFARRTFRWELNGTAVSARIGISAWLAHLTMWRQ